VTLFIALLIAPFAVLTLCFSLEVFAGLEPLRPVDPIGTGQSHRATIIVPAHNEEAILERNLERLNREVPPGVTVLLVADNCSDGTASIARRVGVDVIERSNPDRPLGCRYLSGVSSSSVSGSTLIDIVESPPSIGWLTR